MSERDSKSFWIWGQFDNKSTNSLNEIYSITNSNFIGPKFDLHLTISGPIKFKNDIILEKFYSLKQKLKSFNIKINKYSFSNFFYESLYVSVFLNKNLENLKMIIDKEFDLNQKMYKPHISLFYGKKRTNEKKKLIRTLPTLPECVKLSKLCFVNVNEEKKMWDIEHQINLIN
tara:strand:+ start:105 stop:623 length:519 start_codon:yes stop_codon:yes gene_type:complete